MTPSEDADLGFCHTLTEKGKLYVTVDHALQHTTIITVTSLASTYLYLGFLQRVCPSQTSKIGCHNRADRIMRLEWSRWTMGSRERDIRVTANRCDLSMIFLTDVTEDSSSSFKPTSFFGWAV